MCKNFNFQKDIQKFYPGKTINNATMKNLKDNKVNTSGIYALYLNNELKKIGKAMYRGISRRMTQYYNLNKSGGLCEINKKNRDYINVIYCNFDKSEECWIAERRMQVLAWDCGEKMPWENKTKN